MAKLVELASCQEIRFETSAAKAFAWRVLDEPQDISALAAEVHQRLVKQMALSARRDDVPLPAIPLNAPELPVQPNELGRTKAAEFLRTCKTTILQLPKRMTGVAVARIFHGLGCPAQPADMWRKCGFWEKHRKWDFMKLAHDAEVEINRFYLMNT
eukprot:gene5331-12926_t